MKKLVVVLTLVLAACAGPKGDSGSQGASGPQGPKGDPADNIQALPFCPDQISSVLLPEQYLVINGQIYAVYASSTKTFLALLKPGSYVTTDGRNCHFTVTVDGQILYPSTL